jgi:hypothetical protein
MHSFNDTAGRQWRIIVNVRSIRRVRDMAGIDLMQSAGGDLLGRIASDPVLLVDILWALCEPQATAAGITADDFAEAMLGDAIAEATTAFLGDLVGFFPSQTRSLLQRVLDAAATQQVKAQHLADAKITELLARLQTSGASSPSAPGSTDSTPSP